MKKRILPVTGLAMSIILSVFIMTSNCEAFSSVYAEETPLECMEVDDKGSDYINVPKCPLCLTTITHETLINGECTAPPPAPHQPE